MTINSMFHMTGRGTVLAGRVESGTLALGDDVEICSPTQVVRSYVAGLEVDRKFVNSARSGEQIGVLLKDFSPELVADGLKRNEFGAWEVVDLVLRGKSRPWWKFW